MFRPRSPIYFVVDIQGPVKSDGMLMDPIPLKNEGSTLCARLEKFVDLYSRENVFCLDFEQ